MGMKTLIATTALAVGFALPLSAAETTWTDLRETLYGSQYLAPADGVITIDAPYRTDNDARTQIAAEVTVPLGLEIESVTLILDENPVPVSAVFDLQQPVSNFSFNLTMRINGATPLHLVTKTTNGQLFVSETFVKTSGSGACAAPPGTDPVEALASLGQMELEVSDQDAMTTLVGLGSGKANNNKMLDVDISHPSHSGMQMDQITLLFIQMRYVETVAIEVNGKPFVELTGSISLSENPHVRLSVPGDTRSVDVSLTDTDGTKTKASKLVAGF